MVDLLLSKQYEVRVIDNLSGGRESNLEHHKTNKNLTCEWKDICSLESSDPMFSNVDYVFHFAGIGDIVPSIENPIDYMRTNVQGTVRVLECARAAGVKKFVYAASSSCYGLASCPTKESHKISPQYPYALSKYQGEQAAFHWNQVYQLPVNSVRIFNAYGTRVKTTGVYGAVFGVFFKQKLANKPFTVVGDGTQARDFLYVSDIASGFLAAAETQHVGQTYNLGANNPQSINTLLKLLGANEITYIPKRPGEPDCTWADTSKIQTELNWEPKVSFEDGVAKMLSEIECWQDAPLWTPENIAQATQTWFTYLDNKELP